MESQNTKIPAWYWILAILFLLWNLMGVGSFFMHVFVSQETLDALPPAERELWLSYPFWTKIVFAMATFGGLLGAIGLVVKKKWARTAFIISLAGILPQMIHSLYFTNSREVHGPGTEVMPMLIILIGIFLIWFSTFAIKKGWLK